MVAFRPPRGCSGRLHRYVIDEEIICCLVMLGPRKDGSSAELTDTDTRWFIIGRTLIGYWLITTKTIRHWWRQLCKENHVVHWNEDNDILNIHTIRIVRREIQRMSIFHHHWPFYCSLKILGFFINTHFLKFDHLLVPFRWACFKLKQFIYIEWFHYFE